MTFPMRDRARKTYRALWAAAWAALFWAAALSYPAQAAACVGDCGGDGEVTVDEVTKMVGIALGSMPVSSCIAGDSDGNGEITIEEILGAVKHLLAEDCPTPSPTAMPTPTAPPDRPSISIGSTTAGPGNTTDVQIALTSNGFSVVTIAPLEFVVDADVLTVEACTSVVSSKPASVAMRPDGVVRVVQAGDLTVLPDGPIMTCRFRVSASAAAGPSQLTFQKAEMASPDFVDFTATGTSGVVTVSP